MSPIARQKRAKGSIHVKVTNPLNPRCIDLLRNSPHFSFALATPLMKLLTMEIDGTSTKHFEI